MVLKSKYNIKDYLYSEFGRWVVLAFSHVDGKGQQYWYCRCKCGIEKPVRVSHLFRGLNKGCKFCRVQAGKANDSKYWKGGSFISSSIYTAIKHSAKTRNLNFEITIQDLEDIWEEQAGMCAYTKVRLTLPKNSRDKKFNASVDRIDSSKGYICSNIHWVLKEINIMKMGLKEERFLELCDLVSK